MSKVIKFIYKPPANRIPQFCCLGFYTNILLEKIIKIIITFSWLSAVNKDVSPFTLISSTLSCNIIKRRVNLWLIISSPFFGSPDRNEAPLSRFFRLCLLWIRRVSNHYRSEFGFSWSYLFSSVFQMWMIEFGGAG